MRATLLLLTATFFGSMSAHFVGHGCTRHVTVPSSCTVPTYQPQCQCQCYQHQQPRVSIVPYGCYQPPILQQNIVPQPPPVYQPAPIIVPIAPPPKDCETAKTTVTAPSPPAQPSNETQAMHPAICVQTVYVAKDDEEKECEKCECKKKKKNHCSECEHEHDDYEHEERIIEAKRRAYIREQLKKRQLSRILEALKRLQDTPSYERMAFEPADRYSGGSSSDIEGYYSCGQCNLRRFGGRRRP